MANHGPNDEPKIGTYGLYEDEMVKVDGQWLFAKRNVLNEFIKNRNSGPNNPVARHGRAGGGAACRKEIGAEAPARPLAA